MQPIADKLNVPQATLALAWVLRNPHVSSAITGASRPEQVYGSVKALDLVPKLTDDIMAEIDQVLGNKPEAMQRRFT
jgi:aryl-alcohol dehydrogenase-like predicted oxidoreductase